MRVLACLLLFAAACGPEEGAILTFEGEDVQASRVEVVLASADERDISAIDDPDARPGDASGGTAIYYRQRINIDAIEQAASLTELSLRIEPDVVAATDTRFIPFVFAFDGDTLVAVATFVGADGKPAKVEIEPGMLQQYVLSATPVTQVTADDPITAATGTIIDCAQGAWRSGYAWQPPTGPQLRVLLPDPELDGDMADATQRGPDLDCDQHEAWSDDCDDLRATYHAGAAETCDGADTDCDGRLMEVLSCPSSAGGDGVRLCVDGANPREGACMPDAEIACNGTTPNACAACQFYFHADANTDRTLCAPAVGKLHPGCNDCVIDLVAATGPFKVEIGPSQTGPWGQRVTAPGYFYVRAEQIGSMAFGATATSVGHVYVAVGGGGVVPRLWPIDLQFHEGGAIGAGQCPVQPNGDKTMSCFP